MVMWTVGGVTCAAAAPAPSGMARSAARATARVDVDRAIAASRCAWDAESLTLPGAADAEPTIPTGFGFQGRRIERRQSRGGGVLAQDIPDGCLTTYRTDVPRHGGRAAE